MYLVECTTFDGIFQIRIDRLRMFGAMVWCCWLAEFSLSVGHALPIKYDEILFEVNMKNGFYDPFDEFRCAKLEKLKKEVNFWTGVNGFFPI